MGERYRRVFSLDRPYYEKGAPILIKEGRLLDDGSRRLCQLRFLNLSQRIVTSVTALVTMLDAAGDVLGSELEYSYSGLRAEPDTEFGKGTAILLPETGICSFRVRVREVVFAGGVSWQSAGGDWQAMPPHLKLEERYADPELVTQFRIRYGPDCTHAYAESLGVWYCACGAVNTREDSSCRRCRRVRAALASISDEALRRECAGRLKSEERRRAEAVTEAAARRKKRILLAAILTPLVLAALAAAIILPRNYLRGQTYRAAVNMMELGQFDRAAETFLSLGNYRDSAEQAEKNVPYQRAALIQSKAEQNDPASLLLIGRSRTELNEELSPAMLLYEAAAAEFHALGDYKDSAQREQACLEGREESYRALRQQQYDAAVALLDAGSYSAAREAFLSLGDFGDSAAMAREAIARKAESLNQLVRRYDTSSIYASLSMSSTGTSRFSLPKAVALFLGSQCVADLRDACGGDFVDVTLSDVPAEDMIPLADAVAELFAMAETEPRVVTEEPEEAPEPEAAPAEPEAPVPAEEVPEPAPEEPEPAPESPPEESAPQTAEAPADADPLADYRMLCMTGDIFGAYDWLSEYTGEFPDRDYWLETLGNYMAYCSDWALYAGDSTLLPLTAGYNESCMYCSSRVILEEDGSAVLRITVHGSEEFIVDLYGEPGDDRFYKAGDGCTYVAVVNNASHLSYMKFVGEARLASSCEYETSW